MESYAAEIKSILQNIILFKMLIKNGKLSEVLDRKVAFIENCVSALNEESRVLIQAIYYDGIKVARLARAYYCNRVTVYKKINGIVNRIEKAFAQENFG